jgi:hypothetical protein
MEIFFMQEICLEINQSKQLLDSVDRAFAS